MSTPIRLPEVATVPITRWADDAGHFLAEATVQSEDYRDDGAYYGISSRTWGTCKKCGRVEEPQLVEVGSVEIEIPPLQDWRDQ